MVGEAETARDLAQETFVRGYKLWLEEAAREGWRPLLYKIATNCALDWLRRQRKIRFTSWERENSFDREEEKNTPVYEPVAPQADPAARLEIRLAVITALQKLDANAATCLVLYYDQGFSCSEIARITGASEQAIWQRLSRARRLFCELYRKESTSDA